MKTAHSANLPLWLASFCLWLCLPGSAWAGGRVATWGDNSYRQRLIPSGLRNVRSVATGNYFNLALRADGTVIGWGNDSFHQASPPPGLSNVTAIAAGYVHSLALLADGTVVTWGSNSSDAANVAAGLRGVWAIDAGSEHSLALKTDGTVVAWGRNDRGQTNVPAGLAEVIAVSAGYDHSLALRSDRTVVAWGGNASGQTNTPAGLDNVMAVEAGYAQSFAIKADGTVIAWGAGYSAQADAVPGLSNVVSIASGYFQTLALGADGSLWEVRPEGISAANLPPGLSNVTAVAVGALHSVATVPDGPAEILDQPGAMGVAFQSNVVLSVVTRGFEPLSYQWLFNGVALGGSPRISGVTNASLVISNAQFSDIGVYSVIVSNVLGMMQSSNAALTVISPPVFTQHPAGQAVIAGKDILLLADAIGTPPLSYQWFLDGVALAGATRTSLSLSNIQSSQSGAYWLQTSNAYGISESSNALVTVQESLPYILTQPSPRVALIGNTASFSVTARGSAPLSYQWRFNGADIAGATDSTLVLTALRYNQQGYYAIAISNALGEVVSMKAQLSLNQVALWGTGWFWPTNVPAGLSNLVAISVGNSHVLVLKSDGRPVAWAGPGAYPPAEHAPTNTPSSVTNVVAIAAGSSYNLALQSNGIVKAWGFKAYGTTNVPSTLSNAVAIVAGHYHCLALKSDGRIVAWGAVPDLAYPLPFDYRVMTNVPAGLSNVTAIAASWDRNVAVKRDGTVSVWGHSDATYVPSGLTNVISVAAGDGYNLALQSNGKVTAWPASILRLPVPPRLILPTNVPPTLSNVVAIAAGDEGLALTADGTVVYWTGISHGIRTNAANAYAIAAGRFSAALVGDGSPRFTIQPVGQVVDRGATVRLHARAAGIQPLSYQWQLNGAIIPGATNGSLIMTNLQGRDAGVYRAIASNALGAITSLASVVTIPFSTNLAAALNATNFPWTTSGGGKGWFAQIRETHDGLAAAQSGRVANNEQSTLLAPVVGPGTLTFWWKVSSEEYYDRLAVSVGGMSSLPVISGETDWQQVAIAIPSGLHSVRWDYAKDGTVSAGQDAGWVDEILFVPSSPLKLSGPRLWSDGGLVFEAKDPGGRLLLPANLSTIDVQTSTNLQQWTPLSGACTLSNGVLLIHDPDGTAYPQRFYRLRERQ